MDEGRARERSHQAIELRWLDIAKLQTKTLSVIIWLSPQIESLSFGTKLGPKGDVEVRSQNAEFRNQK